MSDETRPSRPADEAAASAEGAAASASEPLRTLFGVHRDAPRERAALRRRRGAGKLGDGSAGSDTRRFGALVAAAVGAIVGTMLAFQLAPPTLARGALALPHRAGGMTCQSCHGTAQPTRALDGREASPSHTSKICVGCHGPHPSARSAHEELARQGKLGCADCHDLHGTDQGVRFTGSDGSVRYGVGAEAADPRVVLAGESGVTVPNVPLARCQPCHLRDEATRAADPIQRCLVPGERRPDGKTPTVCFDEHRALGAAGLEPAKATAAAVCARQHGPDRVLAWEAAREVLELSPRAPVPVHRGPLPPAAWWLLGAVLGGAAGAAAARGARRLRRRATPPRVVAVPTPGPRKLPVVDASTCLGCHACVDACPYDVFAVERYVAVVARPDACCGLTLCEQVCPNGSVVVRDLDTTPDAPLVHPSLEAVHAPGVFLAGDVTGLPLIKNAILQGARAMDAIHASLPDHGAPLDVLVVGAGPAGISGALRAKELGLRHRVIEQASVAQSIRSFPRGKLVFDQPLELPLTGKLWLEEATKEELLAKWSRIVRAEALAIDEGVRFVGLEPTRDGFAVEACDGEGRKVGFEAARVLLAVGMRGSPRKLDVELAPEVESSVHYHLSDARGFAGKRVVVVGLGDAAMECADALRRQPGTVVTLVHRGADFGRGKSRNVEETRRLGAAGKLSIVWRAEVTAVRPGEVELRTAAGSRVLACDALFVLIGAIPPLDLLRRAGVLPEARGPADDERVADTTSID